MTTLFTTIRKIFSHSRKNKQKMQGGHINNNNNNMELTKRMVEWMDDWKRKTPSWLPRKKLLPLVGAIQHNHEQSGNHNNFPNIYTIWILLCHIIGFLHHFLYGIFFLPFIIYFVKSFIYFFLVFLSRAHFITHFF